MVPLLTRPHVQMVQIVQTWFVVVLLVVVCGKGPSKTWCPTVNHKQAGSRGRRPSLSDSVAHARLTPNIFKSPGFGLKCPKYSVTVKIL